MSQNGYRWIAVAACPWRRRPVALGTVRADAAAWAAIGQPTTVIDAVKAWLAQQG